MAALQFVELLERERVDRPEQAKLPVEFAHPSGRAGALREFRHLGRLGDRRLDVELAAQRLDRGLEPQLRLRLAEFGLPGAFARRVEGPLLLGSLTAEPVEFGA